METLIANISHRCSVEDAYALCETLAKTHYENFTIGSWLLPKEYRQHFYAIYGFCRFVDDLGDEFHGDREQALDFWEQELERCYSSSPRHPYMIALQHTIRSFDIPQKPFLNLIHANRMDQLKTRYFSYKDVESYCRYSANPVGHLILYVCGYRDPVRQKLSDYTCTALQLTNFWQDVIRDFAIGRIYIPLEDLEAFGYSEEELAKAKVTDSFRKLMAFQVDRTRDLFQKGLKLVNNLEGKFKLDVALFSEGGLKILDTIERQNFDVLSRRPEVSRITKTHLMLKTIFKLKFLRMI